MDDQTCKQYEVTPDDFWEDLREMGGDGYDDMDEANKYGWHEIATWGKDGWNLGNWPYVIVFWKQGRTNEGLPIYKVAVYVEGDVTQYVCPTKEIRQEIINGIAFFYWKHGNHEWVRDYATVEEMPPELRGPYLPN